MKHCKRLFGLALAVCLLAGALSGCAQSGGEAPQQSAGETSAAPAGEQKELVIATYLTEAEGLESNIWYKFSRAYEQEHPDIKFNIFTTDSTTYNDKIMTMLAGGDQVDVFWPHTIPMYVQFIRNQYVMDLGALVERDGMDIDSLYSGAADALKYSDGKLYGLPLGQNIWMLFYNQDLFDRQWVEYPVNGMTWEEYGELMASMTYGEGGEKVYGGFLQDWPAPVQNMGIASGIHTFVDEAVDYSFLQHSYELALGWQEAGYVMDYSIIQANSLRYHSLFINQNIASMYMGSWEIPNLINSAEKGELNFTWGAVQAPYNGTEGGVAGNAVGTMEIVCANAKTSYPEETWEFVKWVCSSDASAEIAIANGTVPVHVNETSIQGLLENKGVPEHLLQAYEKTSFVLETPMHDDASFVEEMLNEQHSLIMTGNATIAEGLAEATERMKEHRGE